ncbi:hypothetical protein ACAG25_12805 [Mycobacterium sp. pV006]|uniref:hypothetical protein n=1 Tax=Mycobacterium sp. pV006 TaxID=3238983 RepID=UPI00351B2EB4
MRRFARSALVTTALVSAAAVVGPVPVAAATTMPLSQKLRNCDFTENPYQGADDYGRAAAEMRTDGRTVTAHIAMATGKLNSPYDVRLIQVPRGLYCAPGDPGVAATTMFTDAAGSGTVTLTAPIEQGATGAWVMISRPSALSQHPDEFYTTDYLFRF